MTADMTWQDQAVCREIDPEGWFPDLGQNAAPYKQLCWTACPVREACLEFALRVEAGTGDRHGIYGGYSPNSRAALAAQRRGSTAKRSGSTRNANA